MQPEHHSPTPHKPSSLGTIVSAIFAYWLVSWVVIPVALVLVLHNYVFSAYHVVGHSMVPTLQDADYLIVSKVEKTEAHVEHTPYIPNRGQVIVFHYPKQPELDFVKRVVGLPGDRVVVHNCSVTIFNSQQPQGFNPDTTHQISGACTEGEGETLVPPANVFVLGDNRTPGGSSDSREWGLLPSQNIVGNAVLRLFPFDSIRRF